MPKQSNGYDFQYIFDSTVKPDNWLDAQKSNSLLRQLFYENYCKEKISNNIMPYIGGFVFLEKVFAIKCETQRKNCLRGRLYSFTP